nr:DUF4350 domain-containing protein [Haloferax sp. CBA1150]
MAGGGTLVVAGDFSRQTNDLLRGLGSNARLDGALLRDEQHYYRSPNFTIATQVKNESVTSGVSQLTFNYGTTIQPNNATVLASSSNFSYLDRNGNGVLDDSEELGSRPVVTEEAIGNGRVIVVSDPSLFINAMVDQPDNRRFIRNLVTGSDSIVIDASHQETVPPLTAALIEIDESPLLTGIVGLLGIGVIGLLGRFELVRSLRNRFSESDQDEEDASLNSLSRAIAATHPEWERENVREVIAEVINEDE